MGKKMALVQFAASAANTAGVFFGHGPSSKVSTISPSRRKSWDLKCSKPNPGPPVVSISTTREIPIASGLPGQEVATRGAAAGAGAGAAAGAAGTAGTCGETCAAATVGVFSATIVDGELSVASGGEGGCAALASVGKASCSSRVVITEWACPSVDPSCAGEGEAIGTEDRWETTAPTAATNKTIASAHATAASRMANISPRWTRKRYLISFKRPFQGRV